MSTRRAARPGGSLTVEVSRPRSERMLVELVQSMVTCEGVRRHQKASEGVRRDHKVFEGIKGSRRDQGAADGHLGGAARLCVDGGVRDSPLRLQLPHLGRYGGRYGGDTGG